MRVSIGDVSLFFDVEGCRLVPEGPAMVERPVVVALHGGPGADHSLFKPALSAAAEFAQVVYLDQRGSGRSDRSSPEHWTWERWADDVADFCDALGIADPVLLGTSSGGWVALLAALRHPARVAGLVLDSVIPGATEERLEIMERLGGLAARETARRYWAGEDTDEVRRAWRETCLPLYSRRPGGAETEHTLRRIRWNEDVLEHFRHVLAARFDHFDRPEGLACPALLLAGEHDPVATASAARRFAARLPAARTRLHVLPATGHGAFRENPALAHGHLRDFLQEFTPARPEPA
ncbi:alpha/beta fold hydrolase [Streptomonospora sp. PA3]|uniref:alpha/beta fold hydrolase n=1 Tax=Streptomonospora sp. PA3 TaxID=2607326 RepID=UPI0012DC531F|nr:alpha/beta fold hydrolase [Streptomonospora sp. PA3]MUL42589.1 alpha/beta fold hydrolase [Streptomonospora sp. PA3]